MHIHGEIPMKNRTIGLGLLIMLLAVLVQPVTSQVPGQAPLNPQKIPQFVDPLPHFAGLRVDAKAGGSLIVKAVPHTQVAVSTGTKLATGTAPTVGLANVWVYQISKDGGGTWTPPLWPAFTIEAERGHGLEVTYRNELYGQTYANVNLVVDPTLHAADPLMMMPWTLPQPGEPPITVHLHGGEVPPLSDGGPDSWYTPGYADQGHSFNPAPYVYPNDQEPATLWFHDHVLGATRLNVYAGMAGFYFLRGGATEDALHLPGWSGDNLVQEVQAPGTSGVFNPNPYLPEIEVAIQDRTFDTNGGLYYPNLPPNPLDHPTWTPEFVGDVITVNGKTWPFLSVAPRKYRFRILNGSNARFYNLSLPKGGPTITQIGTDGGFLDAPVALGNGPLLLAPGERADVIIDFSPFAPVATKKGAKVQSFILGNDARTPFPGGAVVRGNTTGRIMRFVVNGTMVTSGGGVGADLSAIPASLKSNVKLTDFAGAPAAGVPVVKNRQLTLNEVMGPGGPLEVLVNNTKWSGVPAGGTTTRNDFTPVENGDGTTTYYSETVDEGTTEIWQIINLTADAHPIHLHLVQFQLMSRQPFDVKGYTAVYDGAFPGGLFLGGYGPPLDYNANQTPGGPLPTIGGNPDVTPYLVGAPLPANPNENGWKDTFIMYPGEVTTVIARWAPTDKGATLDPTNPANELWFSFDPNGGHGYVWHCHIIDHEDNEMMRPYNVMPNPLARLGKRGVDLPIAESLPGQFSLSQNYPNPFNPETTIEFALPKDVPVRLNLYNNLGQEMQTLINEVLPAGNHTVRVDAKNLASGVYFYKISAGTYTATKSMVLVR
jgi:spore coat protein A